MMTPDLRFFAAPRGFLLILLSFVFCALFAGPGVEAAQVTLARDERGVTHVFARTQRGAMYGAGWATARDRMLQMHWTRRAAQGRLAELMGLLEGASETTLEHDVRQRLLGSSRHAEAAVAGLNKRTRKLLEAYCAGVNAFLAEHGDALAAPWLEGPIEPWTPADCLLVWDRLVGFFQPGWTHEAASLHAFEEAFAEHGDLELAIAAVIGPPLVVDDAAAVVQEHHVSKKLAKKIARYVEDVVPPGPIGPTPGEVPSMSHAWAVSKSRLTTRRGVLQSDPQTAVSLPSLWYELRLRGGGRDVRGLGVAGCPAFLIGWNRRTAWGVTALGVDQADLFRLDVEGLRDAYRVDGEVLPFEIEEETLLVRGEESVTLRRRESLFGPVVTELVPAARSGEEYALALLPQRAPGPHTVQAALLMQRARGVKALRKSARRWVAPGVHLVAADRAGRILYQLLAAVPLRSGLSPLAGQIAQDGGTIASDWLEFVPFPLLPWVLNPPEGVLFTANHLPVASFYRIPLRVVTGGTGDTARSWRLRELLVEEAPALFTPAEVAAVHDDVVHPWRREIARLGFLLRERGAIESPEALAALDLLEEWLANGALVRLGEVGSAVAGCLGTNFRLEDAPELVPLYGSGQAGLSLFLKSLGARFDADPEAPFDPAEAAWIEASLAVSILINEEVRGPDPSTWDADFAASHEQVKLAYGATLEGFGSRAPELDLVFGPIRAHDPGTLAAQRTQSYSQFVDFSALHESRALLPVGVSEDPASPHHADQAPAWLAGSLEPASLLLKKALLGQGGEVLVLSGAP